MASCPLELGHCFNMNFIIINHRIEKMQVRVWGERYQLFALEARPFIVPNNAVCRVIFVLCILHLSHMQTVSCRHCCVLFKYNRKKNSLRLKFHQLTMKSKGAKIKQG